MAVLWLLLLVGLPTFLLGLLVWCVVHHFVTAEIPSALKNPVKLRFLHCLVLYLIALGNTLEKLRICSMPKFVRFIHDLMRIRKDPTLVVTNLHFGTIPVRLFQPKAASSNLQRDFCHSLCSCLARETDSVVLSVGYRMLPDYHHPVFLRDCLNASIHFLKDLQTYGVDPSRVVACGESIGGWAVAVVTQALVSIPNLPQIQAQVLICPIVHFINFQLPSYQQKKNIPLLTRDIVLLCMYKYLAIDPSWEDAILKGTCVPPENWTKYRKWLSSDNIPKMFQSQDPQSEFPGPFNEAAYLETNHVWNEEISPLLADDKTIAQLPKAFLVSCEYDVLRDDVLLYKKRLEDQGVPVSWYHVEDGFHGCVMLFGQKLFSFPCSLKAVSAVVSYIKGI
ncbi:arylacetamide deacetylase-like 4 isoform X2 [Nannospalax galili]|uniref:arylacetamide deacetylase-like 4 isoform X2 n=1 Tax=Nannospalax galili TaxID=1026970 RepID=UPI0004ED041B|nr:arylacetamide deacetylase-like 4 isoform X2 [Nannospalax galili]